MPTEQDQAPLPILYPDLNRLPDPPDAPRGFHLRTWRDRDRDPVSRLMADAFQDPSMAVYEDQLGHFHARPGVEPAGCFVVEAEDGLPVATAIGRVDPAQPRVAHIHQVATRRTHQRQGLGTLAVLRALHYARDRGAEFSIMRVWPGPMFFYLGMGFAPLVCEEAELGGVPLMNGWETAQLWREMYQFLAQVSPSERHILDRCPPRPPEGFPRPDQLSAAYAWHDDFLVDDDGDLWETHATVCHGGVRFAGRVIAPEDFAAALPTYPASREKPVLLALAHPQYESVAADLRDTLHRTGYPFAGVVDPRPT